MSDTLQMTAEEYLEQLLEKAFWEIGYHTRQLQLARSRVNKFKELFRQAEMPVPAEEGYDSDDDDFESLNELLVREFQHTVGSAQHHEEELKDAHGKLAAIQSIAARMDYAGDFEAIRTKALARLRREA